MAASLLTYSFIDTFVTMVGPGFASFDLGYGSAAAEEGISIEMSEDKTTMMIGADGSPMPILHAGKGGLVTLRYLKNSPTNLSLSAIYNAQSLNSANWGQNVIVIKQNNSQDVITCSTVAFQRLPRLAYGKEAGINEWPMICGKIDMMLAAGTIA